MQAAELTNLDLVNLIAKDSNGQTFPVEMLDSEGLPTDNCYRCALAVCGPSPEGGYYHISLEPTFVGKPN